MTATPTSAAALPDFGQQVSSQRTMQIVTVLFCLSGGSSLIFETVFTRSKLALLAAIGKMLSFSPDSTKRGRGAIRPATSY